MTGSGHPSPSGLARRRGRPPALVRALVLVALGAVAACEPRPAAERAASIPRATFIATYVDLRTAATQADDGLLTDAARRRVLTKHGVTEAQMLEFVEVHGRDVEYMQDVWAEVEALVGGSVSDTLPSPADTARAPAPAGDGGERPAER